MRLDRIDPGPASHRLDEVLHDRETEPGAAHLARAPRVHAVEPLEHTQALVRGDARAVVAVNAVYAEYFTGVLPARATVQVSRLPRDAR